MKTTFKTVSIVLAAILCAQLLIASAKPPAKKTKPAVKAKTAQASKAKPKVIPKVIPIPRLLDLGADKCVPCKMMVPVLDDLTKVYKGKLKVEFIDVWKNPSAGEKYKIQVIPTQIFFDAKGKEIARHSGYYSKADILKTFKDKGIDLNKKSK